MNKREYYNFLETHNKEILGYIRNRVYKRAYWHRDRVVYLAKIEDYCEQKLLRECFAKKLNKNRYTEKQILKLIYMNIDFQIRNALMIVGIKRELKTTFELKEVYPTHYAERYPKAKDIYQLKNL